VIRLKWIFFEIEEPKYDGSCYDYVKITDKDGSVLMDKTCGKDSLPDPVEFSSNTKEILIEFYSDAAATGKGFHFDWTSIDPSGRKKRESHKIPSSVDLVDRRKRQTVNLVTTREVECVDWPGRASTAYWKYGKQIPHSCYSKETPWIYDTNCLRNQLHESVSARHSYRQARCEAWQLVHWKPDADWPVGWGCIRL
jgi:hypothetical protein